MMAVMYVKRSPTFEGKIRQKLGRILQKQFLVDMTVICATHSIRVHKCVIAANSNYMEKVILTLPDELIIVLKDLSFQALR